MPSLPETAAGYVALTGTVQWDEVAYWSRNPELGVASCGDTIEEALDNLGEALAGFFEDLAVIGTLEQELRESGITIHTAPPPAAAVTVTAPIGKIIRVYTLPVPVLAAVAA